jgi:hypothetical protein
LAKPNSGYRYLPPARKSLSPAKEADGLRVIYYWQALANLKMKKPAHWPVVLSFFLNLGKVTNKPAKKDPKI